MDCSSMTRPRKAYSMPRGIQFITYNGGTVTTGGRWCGDDDGCDGMTLDFGSSRSKEEGIDLDIDDDDEGEDKDDDEGDVVVRAISTASEGAYDGVECRKNGKTPGNSTNIRRREKSVMNILDGTKSEVFVSIGYRK